MSIKSIVIVATFIALADAAADEAVDQEPRKWRAEIGLFAQNWQGLTELRPANGGSFDSVGFGLFGAMHWPIMTTESSRVLLGFDAAIGATDSSTPGFARDLMARQMSIGPSLRWEFGDKHPVSVNAGVSWYLLDIAEADYGFNYSPEVEYWEDSAAVPFVGISMDRDLGTAASLTFGLKVYMSDFGRIYDEDA